ncbi:hypothetical protein CRUP_035501 [Coryphaenoides rupestris]|nr:hypothetical protein CRUP_035501 [Coryphaenoides rupestris]
MVPGLPADQKKVLVFEAFGYAEKALEKDDTCFTSHKWYGILLSDYVKPGFYSKNLLMLGKTYLAMKDLDERTSVADQGQRLPAHQPRQRDCLNQFWFDSVDHE